MLDTFTSRSFQEAVVLVVVVSLLLLSFINNVDDDADAGNSAEEEGPIILVAAAFLLEIIFDRDDADVVNALVDGSRLSKIASLSALSLEIMPDANAAASFEFDIVIVLSSMKASCSSSSIDMNSRYLR